MAGDRTREWARRSFAYRAIVLALFALGAVVTLLAMPAFAAAAPPAHNDFAQALSLGEEVDSRSGSTFEATKEPGEPDHAGDPGGASVWYAWTAPRSAHMFMQVCTDGWDALIGVYKGASLSALTPVASSRSAPGGACRELRFRVTGAVSYRFAVDGYSAGGANSADRGGFELSLRRMTITLPENDAFAQAAVIDPDANKTPRGTIEGASREAGEPVHGASGGSASVWYRWTASRAALMHVFPCSGDFDPAVGVYTGASLAGLQPVGRPVPPEPWAGNCRPGGIAFDAVAGETYFIAMDSANGAWGPFQLFLGAPPPALPPDTYPPPSHVTKMLRGRKGRVTFLLSSELDATLLCRLDKRKFVQCGPRVVYRDLRAGWHRLVVKAVDMAGNVDPTPAIRRFRVLAR